MKKKFFVLFVSLLSIFALCSCSNFKKISKNISEYRENVFVGQNAKFTAEAVTGYRETPFEIDGISGEKSEFCLVTVKPNEPDLKEHKYKIALGGVEYEGDFVKHPFEESYSFEVAARAEGNTISVMIDDEKIELNSVVTENFISAEKAYEIAKKKLSDHEIIKGGKYEIYLRLIANPVSASGGYFWYVAFVNTERETCAVLIHPESMEIIAVRE